MSGSLPPGLTLNPATGEITGIPTAGGSYSFTVQAQDNYAYIDTQALSIQVVSVLTTPVMDPASDTGASNADNITRDNTPTFTGSCTNGETITLHVDGVPITPTQVCTGGAYAITPSSAIADGNHTVSAHSSAGFASPGSVSFTVDTVPPAAPVITGPSRTTSTTPDITGTGEPDTTVVLTDENGKEVCTTVVDSSGNWKCRITEPLLHGVHALRATLTDRAGNISPQSAGFTITVSSAALADTGQNIGIVAVSALGLILLGATLWARDKKLGVFRVNF